MSPLLPDAPQTRRNTGGRRAVPRSKPHAKSPQADGKRRRIAIVLLLCLLLLAAGAALLNGYQRADTRVFESPRVARLAALNQTLPDWVTRDILPKSAASRRGELLTDFQGVAIHYVGNPGSSAAQNRAYFGNKDCEVNAHFVVGLEGEIIQCLPLEEKSSATSQRNTDTVSIEVCHPDETGEFDPRSYAAAVALTAWLCRNGDLDADLVIRHYDVTGKLCPLYYVEHPDAWARFLRDVRAAVDASDAA
jgi:N-acetylmuramoyl-L-alanine amidase